MENDLAGEVLCHRHDNQGGGERKGNGHKYYPDMSMQYAAIIRLLNDKF